MEKEWKFLLKTATINLEGPDGINTYLSSIRVLLNKALQIGVQDLNEDAIISIMQFSLQNRLTLTLREDELSFLVCQEAYDMISLLVSASVQLERPKNKQSVGKITKEIMQSNVTKDKEDKSNLSRVELTLQEVVNNCTQL